MKVSTTPQKHVYDGIQLLRFVAAFMVLITHATFFVQSRGFPEFPVWEAGAQGVSLFFVISGFVMMNSAEAVQDHPHAFRRFLTSRIIRVVPLYWAVSFAKLGLLLILPGLVFASPTVSNVVLSLLFIPSKNANGVIEAFYGVGWTLNFEMAFYLLVAITLLLRIRTLPVVIAVLIVGAAVSTVRQDSWPAVTSLLDTILLNFVWGMLLAYCEKQGWRLKPWIAVLAICGGSSVIIFLQDQFVFELQYVAVVAGVVALESKMKDRLPKWAIFGGDASYSLYLVHPTAGVIAAVLLTRMNLPVGIVFLAVVGVCLVSSALVYWCFEKPVTAWLKKISTRHRSKS